MHQATPVTESLQAATYDYNVRIGELPFFKSASVRPLAAESYIALLHGLTTIYDAFEQAIGQVGDPAVRAVWGRDLHKRTLLQQDLAAFGAAQVRQVPAAELSAEALAEHLRLRASYDPRSLIGSAYALATWYMGGAPLCEHLRTLLQLAPGAGLSYLASFDGWGQAHWPEFAGRLNDIPLEAEAQQQAVLAARETLDGIEQLINVLHPLNENPLGELVTILNPLAGNHPISGDMVEIKAALRAHARMQALFPYMEIRYGMKGRKFSWSDGGWLASLAAEDQVSVNHNVQWLARLLARRGMPQWFMECHLCLLHEELVQALPERRDSYATLLEVARVLAEERRATVSDEAMAQLDSVFYERVGPEWRAWMPNCGGLLASAVADERAGVPHVMEAIEGWMIDPARFPEAWVAAVHDVISRARSLA